MNKKLILLLAAAVAVPTAPLPHTNAQPPKSAPGAASKPDKPQAEVAAKNVTFGKIIATDARVMSATKASDLAAARKQIGKTARFQGTVAKVFAPRSNNLVILNFDKNYRNAVTAVVRSEKFARFPDLKTLEGKKVLVSGKVTDFKGQPEVELAAPTDIKIIP